MRIALNHGPVVKVSARYLPMLVLATVVLLICAWQWTSLRSERADIQQQLNRLQGKLQPAQAQAIQPQSLSSTQKSEIKEANQVLDELGRPWPALLLRLEQSASPDVALMAIRPDAAKGRLRLKGEARDVAALLAYLQRLEAVPEMHDVVLDEHELMEKPEGEGVARFIHFGVSARWGQP